MGARTSKNECCYYQPNKNSLFIKGYYRILTHDKIAYPLSKKKKRHLDKFFISIGQLINLSDGLIIHISNEYPPIENIWVRVQLYVDKNNIGMYYYNSDDVGEKLVSRTII